MTDEVAKKDSELVSVQPEILSFVDKTDLGSLDYDELVNLGRAVNEVKTYSSWLLGKLGDAEMKKYGDIKKYALDIGQNLQVLYNYITAYRKYTAEDPDFTPDKYFGQVPWGMLYLVSQQDRPVTLLNELVDKGVKSMEHAYREIKKKAGGKEVPKKPRIVFSWNSGIGKWNINLDQKDLDLIDWQGVKDMLINYLNSLA